MKRILKNMKSKFLLKILLKGLTLGTKETSAKISKISEKNLKKEHAHSIMAEKKEFLKQN